MFSINRLFGQCPKGLLPALPTLIKGGVGGGLSDNINPLLASPFIRGRNPQHEFRTPLVFAIVAILSLTLLSCKSANVASTGASLVLSATPQQIGSKGTSQLTVTGTDENGAPLPDGTQVSFSVKEAGRVTPNAVQLVNGTATSTYFATAVSGDITITATSGSTQASTTVSVADSLAKKVFISANPAVLPGGGGTSVISAAVTDNVGTPLQGVDVKFSTTQGTLQSRGAFITTDNNGLATDTLNTTNDALVKAETDDGFSDETTVSVSTGRIVCHMTVSTSTPKVGETVMFFDTSEVPDGQAVRFHWDFADGSSADGQNVQHAYNSEGTFNVVHSVIDESDNPTLCDPFLIQVSR